MQLTKDLVAKTKIRAPSMSDIETIYSSMNEARPFPYVENGIVAFGSSPTSQTVVGFVYIKPLGHQEADIIYVGVLPEHRQQGVARGLIQGLQDSYTNLYLEVESTNSAAIALYQGLGFTLQRTRQHYYGFERHGLDMAWSCHHDS